MTNNKDCLRIFIASFFEEDAENLVKPLQNIDGEMSSILRKVLPEKIHLTWKFLGDFPVFQMQDLINEVNEAAKSTRQTFLNMTGIEIWPNRRKPRQIVITSNEKNPVVNSFFNTLEDRLFKLDIAKESRELNPHITIARFKKNTKCNRLMLQPLENFIQQSLCINNIKIVQSNLTCNGPDYKILHNISLT